MPSLLKLKGKTRHGKNRIHQHGEMWRVERESTFRGQPAWSLRSMAKTFGVGYFAGGGVLNNHDPNFEVVT